MIWIYINLVFFLIETALNFATLKKYKKVMEEMLKVLPSFFLRSILPPSLLSFSLSPFFYFSFPQSWNAGLFSPPFSLLFSSFFFFKKMPSACSSSSSSERYCCYNYSYISKISSKNIVSSSSVCYY